MTKSHLPTSIVFLAFLVTLIGATGSEWQNDCAAVLSLSLGHARIDGSCLCVGWRISNRSRKRVYVYATFLWGPAALEPTNQAGLVRVRTSLSTPEPAGVNAYPPAKFLRIEPGGVLSGRFTEGKLDRKILKGGKPVEMDGALGSEINQPKKKISMTPFKDQHPQNPLLPFPTQPLTETTPATSYN